MNKRRVSEEGLIVSSLWRNLITQYTMLSLYLLVQFLTFILDDIRVVWLFSSQTRIKHVFLAIIQ